VSSNRAYWWDGTRLRWIDRGGSIGSADLSVPDQVAVEFAVSPDDTRIVITEIDFRKSPLHRTTWVEDLGSHAHKSVLFDAVLSGGNITSAGWPWGWHAGNPVLYDYPLCITGGGDQFFALNHPRVVDPATGNQLVTFPDCYGGTITDGGVFCTTSPSASDNPFTARALDWIDWSGKQIRRWPLPYQTVACQSDLKPAHTTILANCQPNIYAQPAGADTHQREIVFGTGPQLPAGIANYPVRWLDNDLVLVPGQRATGAVSSDSYCPGCPLYANTIAVWSLNSQKQVANPVDVPGNEIGRFAPGT